MRKSIMLSFMTAIALAIVIGGCGSSGSSSKSTGGSTPSGGGPALSGPPIKIGTLGSYTGPQAAAVGAMGDAMKAWAAYTNAHGGVNGHPVQLFVEDDQENPTLATQMAKTLIQQDKVVAFVGSGSPVTDSWAQIPTQAGVPVIGAFDFDKAALTNPDYFPSGAQIPALVYGLLQEAKQEGVTSLGVLPCAEVSACATFAAVYKAVGNLVGLPVKFQQQIAVSQPSFTSVCLAAKASGVNGLVTIQNAATVVKVTEQCAQQGYKPKVLNSGGSVGQAWEGNPVMEGATAILANAPASATNIAPIKVFNAAIGQYAPQVKTGGDFTGLTVSAWVAGEIFKLAAEKAKLTPQSSSADLLKGLDQLKAANLGGLTTPLTYVKGKPTFVTCWFAQKIGGQKFVPLHGGGDQCIPAATLPQLAKALGG